MVDSLLQVLLSTSMFLGGVCGFILDNTIPGTGDFSLVSHTYFPYKWREPYQKQSFFLNASWWFFLQILIKKKKKNQINGHSLD